MKKALSYERAESTYLAAGHASGGPFFSALPEKKGGRKGALGYVWCVLRVRFRQVLIFSRCEHANSPYVRLRALWYAPPVTVHQD